MYKFDKRIVITLDAGGTNFVFGAMQSNEFIVDPITMPSNAQDLDLCLSTMVSGFEQVISKLDQKPVAISFAFPGPADYPHGIIGGYLPNFPSFRNGVALGPFLEEKFGIPVYINNDGDLFAYGEALGGILPEINARLAELGSSKRYSNLLGFTFGTGFGIGMVIDNNLNRGNNSCVEIFCNRHKNHTEVYVEEGVAIRAIKRVYAEKSGEIDHTFEPKDICEIAEGTKPGNREAAIAAFEEFGEVAGDAIATAVTLTDSLVVIGGGLTGAKKYFMPALMKQLNGVLHSIKGEEIPRMPTKAFDLDDEEQFVLFANGAARPIKVYGTERTVIYDPMKATGVAMSKLGASKAISIGAYSFALSMLDRK
ncbi:MAG: ROK family protein [Bacteroides sp.]|nr:ROK family protein [Bacteroides sp.]MBD5350349.1 ROK family protein [Bacteroides sp.]MDE5805327.1 ROK family protein [Paramuribaculum sp.]MDE6039894.1 ROK family protein [Paramuribaculum sp.]MDE6050836.1 ROK family protein [Paramuribaculum sp.]